MTNFAFFRNVKNPVLYLYRFINVRLTNSPTSGNVNSTSLLPFNREPDLYNETVTLYNEAMTEERRVSILQNEGQPMNRLDAVYEYLPSIRF